MAMEIRIFIFLLSPLNPNNELNKSENRENKDRQLYGIAKFGRRCKMSFIPFNIRNYLRVFKDFGSAILW